MMLGLTFWKSALGARAGAMHEDTSGTRHRRPPKPKRLLVASAAVAFAVIASGAPDAGIAIYLLAMLLFMLRAS
ncbi:hypothetical protein DF107_32885 [Burkholderia stagnalis]|nr:hypothetical protein DF161_32780 [Burkholderia stagnalis]RQQ92714.1 hypothetical protein DF031_31785 [Burkholderia stagnalis]RQX85632.1 hypothetical protein DF120_32720 [Burkholderia stagnalis]RQY75514.1 hypothetical protein DF107_32885 [Burkholderia stagnalis]